MKIVRRTIWVQMWICLTLFGLPLAPCLGAFSDFSDPGLWTPYYIGSGPTIVNGDNTFSVNFPADSHGGAPIVIAGYTTSPADFGAGYISTFTVRGDFTMDANYELGTWGSGNGVRVGIWCAPWYSSQRVSQPFSGSPLGDERYVFAAGGISGAIDTTDTSGRLRLTRSGTALSGYFWDSARGWVRIGTGTFTAQDFQISVEAWSHDYFFGHQTVEVAMGHVELSSSGYSPQDPIPEPAIPEPGTFLAGFLLLIPSAASWARGWFRRI